MTQVIKWDTAKLLPSPTKNRPNKRETKVLVICSHCQKSRWLRKRDAKRAAKKDSCKYCAAKKGYQAMLDKYGRAYTMAKLAEYRRENPSEPEKQAVIMLDNLGVNYQREFLAESAGRYALFDFVVGGMVIEIDGDYVHQNKDEAHTRQQEIAKDNGLIINRVLVSNLDTLPELVQTLA